MLILFPSSPLNAHEVDPDFATQFHAAQGVGFQVALLDTEALDQNQFQRAARSIKISGSAIYRGWMVRAEQYTELYKALIEKEIYLLTNPIQYKHTHHLPENYNIIKNMTARSIWIDAQSTTSNQWLDILAEIFGSSPLIIKDYVKSQKHNWYEACYITAANDRDAIRKVVSKFVELQGNSLVGGIVFREFLPLQYVGHHSKSGMPLTHELRLFCMNGRVIMNAPYWEEGCYNSTTVPDFSEICSKIQSPFFTMDIAQKLDGTWAIIELGDGQVAGLPASLAPLHFYKTLVEHLL